MGSATSRSPSTCSEPARNRFIREGQAVQIKQLTPFLHLSPQIAEAELGVLAAQGFRSVINNRPDDEGEGQPASAALAAAAEGLGLAYRHIPVVSGQVTDADVTRFGEALGELQGPVLAFCRTGTRSTTLWALGEAWHLDPAAILRTAAAAGYDLEALRPRLETRARTDVLRTAAAALPRPITFDVVIVGGGAGSISTAAGRS